MNQPGATVRTFTHGDARPRQWASERPLGIAYRRSFSAYGQVPITK